MDPSTYDAWYHTPRGAWIGAVEFEVLMRLLQPVAGASLLDVGSGSGYFSRCFAAAGLAVTGVDPDPAMVEYARSRDGTLTWLRAGAAALPFGDASFDYVSAITSLCFVAEPERALREMWRVARRGVVLGLLNRHSLLYARKRERGGYVGARWDRVGEARRWASALHPMPQVSVRSAVFFPSGGPGARAAETLIPGALPWGAFLALCLRKS
jgi:SAM-dependent methyltransferase